MSTQEYAGFIYWKKNLRLNKVKDFFLMMENQLQTKIDILRSDNGTEYFNQHLGAFLL